MEVVTILEEQTLAFSYNANYGAYGNNSNPSLFLPEVGQTYHVVFDGTEYVCTAVSMDGSNLLGNLATFGGEDTGEPFLMSSLADGSGMTIFCLSGESHTLAVYKEVADEEESSGNVLADLFQDQANAIREGLGDIGTFAPATFAAKIREINALIGSGGSGGGGSALFKIGQVTTTSQDQLVISHDFGVQPDLVVIYSKDVAIGDETGLVWGAVGVSTALAELSPGFPDVTFNSAGSLAVNTAGMNNTSMLNTFGSLYADETNFKFGGKINNRVKSGVTYYWVAVGGLT